MAYILLLISIFIKEIITSPVDYIFYLSRLPIYFYIVLILISIAYYGITKNNNIFNSKVVAFTILLLCFQFISMMISYLKIGSNSLNLNPIKQFVLLVIFILCITIHYLVVKLTINTNKNIERFIKGNGIALILVLLIAFLQFLYLLAPNLFGNMAAFIGSHLENRVDRDWYVNGSYVQTLQRLNGLNSEASYLAVQLIVVFAPFLLASIKNKFNIFSTNKKYNPMLFYFLLISIITILFFAKTTTGIIAASLIVLFLWFSLPLKRKYMFTLSVVLICLLISSWMINNPIIIETLNNTLFNKDVGSTQNRSGSTVALIITWLQNIVLGVGWGYHDYFIFENVPEWSKNNYEYQNVFSAENFYPILSVISGWLAEFGTISIVFVFIYIYKLLKDFRFLRKNADLICRNERECKMIDTISDAAHYFLLFYFICSMFSFYWYESIYLIMFFFFVVVRQNLKWKLNNSLKNIETRNE